MFSSIFGLFLRKGRELGFPPTLFPNNPDLALMVIHGFLDRRPPLVLRDLANKFPLRQDDPAVPIFKRLSRLPVLEDDFYLLDNPFVANLFLIDPLDDGSKQVVFVAIQRLDFTDDHFDLLL